MPVKASFFIFSIFVAVVAVAQQPLKQVPVVDSTFTDYDALFNELDALLDSLTAPRSFTVVNVGIRNSVFNYQSNTAEVLQSKKKLLLTPSIAYFDKTGFGINGEASVIKDAEDINAYQYSLSGSYDYMRNRKFITGISLTHFFTKSALPFYTSPLQNEAYGYFSPAITESLKKGFIRKK